MRVKFQNNLKTPMDYDYEVVERKGVGHPDTLADEIAETISVEYSKYCLNKFGVVLHHNFDKVCIMGGLIKIEDWGKGKLVKPIRVLINGRVSRSFKDRKIPLDEIYKKAVFSVFKKRLPNLNPEKWIRIIDESTSYSKNPRWFNPKSILDLPEYERPFANDTSAVVSYWPLTPAEELALALEGVFYFKNQRPRYQFIGHDIKIMVVRKDKTFDVTLCVPFIITKTPSYKFYKEKVKFVKEILYKKSRRVLGKGYKINIFVNNHYKNIKKENIEKVGGYYCNITGSALDYGEEGVVGRGNNRLGIIPSFRPYTMEAACGKNPVYHVGKVLGVFLDILAKRLANRFHCYIEIIAITKVADPLYQPANLLIRSSKKIDKSVALEIIADMTKMDITRKIIFDEVLIPKVQVI